MKIISYPSPLPKFEQDENGKIVSGIAQDTNKNGNAGRPCGFCEHEEEYLGIVKEYYDESQKITDKKKYPSIAELAMKMGIYRQRISEWAEKANKNGELEHPEFADYIKRINTAQFHVLELRLLGRYNPTGSIFLMKTQQGQIETEKKILAGGNGNDPLEIRLVEDKRNVE